MIDHIDHIVAAYGDGCLSNREATYRLLDLEPSNDHERAAVETALTIIETWGVTKA